MATDVLVLGGIVFDDWSAPSRMPFGGRQAMSVHKLPGGARVVDILGPDEQDIHFTGLIYGDLAYGAAEALDAMRISGQTVPLIFAGRFYQVIVQELTIDLHRFPQLMGYTISCLVVSNALAGTLSTIASTVGDLVSADIATALNIAGL